jgi:NAD(P)-dependent dehydrogenase (short-subunit alcohol dehydrogenase family)
MRHDIPCLVAKVLPPPGYHGAAQGTAEEVPGVVMFLLSNKASYYITGRTFAVDGGLTTLG